MRFKRGVVGCGYRIGETDGWYFTRCSVCCVVLCCGEIGRHRLLILFVRGVGVDVVLVVSVVRFICTLFTFTFLHPRGSLFRFV